MRAFCFTVDLDRDVNIQVPGGTAAGSIDRGVGNSPRFTSSQSGLEILLDILKETGVRATFFAEGRTLETISSRGLSNHEVGVHGYDHEDMSSMNGIEVRECLEKAVGSVRRAVGKDPVSFRAPYMKAGDTVLDILPEFGIRYDSSSYVQLNRTIMPRKLPNGIIEMPVPEGVDSSGKKIAAYLWPMHEGKRQPEDYVKMASEVKEGVFVLATHTWHMTESRDRGIMGPEEISKNAEKVREVMEMVRTLGFEPMTLSECAERFLQEKN